MPENNQKPNKNYAVESAKIMSVAFELGFIIALPIVGFALLGKWLDSRYGTHYYIYIGVAVAVITTSVMVYKRFAAMIEKLNQAARNTDNNKDNNENK